MPPTDINRYFSNHPDYKFRSKLKKRFRKTSFSKIEGSIIYLDQNARIFSYCNNAGVGINKEQHDERFNGVLTINTPGRDYLHTYGVVRFRNYSIIACEWPIDSDISDSMTEPFLWLEVIPWTRYRRKKLLEKLKLPR